jgi:hypothetical protein
MQTLVALETVLLVLLVLLVAGLLRSHAEILRRLGPGQEAAPSPLASPPAASRWSAGSPAPPVAGATPAGDAVKLAFDGGASAPTLLAFLTSGCSTCAGFWAGLGEDRLPDGVQPVIVTHGRDRESPSRLRKLMPDDVPVVMSSEAWDDYAVPGSPYFVLVDGAVRGEGVATAWPALASLITDAIDDEREAMASEASGDQPTAPTSARGIDATFAAAGIAPDDPSLYPAGRGASTSTQPARTARSAERA